jgi:hypothetical protein
MTRGHRFTAPKARSILLGLAFTLASWLTDPSTALAQASTFDARGLTSIPTPRPRSTS